ncbi:hypothetical protein [Kitasatospora indigofera]|uniref:hypothetical protein n=1 Tax=Kitasatospora indigofera TaxID=67307 RepID=UPI0032469ADC
MPSQRIDWTVGTVAAALALTACGPEGSDGGACFSYFTYEIALDSAGKITSAWEVFHS